MKSIKIKTSGMHCKSCEMLVCDSLSDNKGIASSKADHKSGLIEVNFDEKIISEQKIKEVIEKEGYKVGK